MLRKLFILTAVVVFTLALTVGCGQKADQESDKVPTEVKSAEMADSTRMDSAATEMADSAGAVMEGEATEGEAAGH